MKGNTIPVFIFIIGCLFWVILYAFIAPQHAGTDFFIFKDAGVNLAYGKGFVEVTTPDNLTLTPKLYSAYPPVYALLYGVYTMVAGLGAYENTYFNLTLSILWSGIMLWIILKYFSIHLSVNYKLIFSICCVLLIPVTPSHDRPENAILLFFFLSFLSFYSNSPHRLFFTFLFVGANFVTSPFGGVANLLFISVVLFHPFRSVKELAFTKKQNLVKALIGVLVIPILWFFSYSFQDSNAFFRLFIHGTQKGGLTHFLNFLSTGDVKYYIVSFRHIASSGLFFGITFAGIFIISHFVPIFFFATRFIRTRQMKYLLFTGVFGAIFVGTTILFPVQVNYMWVLSIMSTTLFFILICSEEEPCLINWPLSFFVIIVLLCQPRTIRDVYTRMLLQESYRDAMQDAKELSGNISGKWVSINPLQYFALKPYANVGRDAYCENPAEKYGFVAVGYRDLKIGELSYPTWFDEKKYDLVYKPDISKFAPKTKLDEIMLRPTDLWQFALYKKRQ